VVGGGGGIDFGLERFEGAFAVFDFGEFTGDLRTEFDDLGDGSAVFAFEAVEEGKAVFDFGEALGAGVDSFGVVAEAGGYVADDGAGGG